MIGPVLLTVRGRNYTMKVMPTPMNDAAAALRVNQTKTEQALRKVVHNFSHTFEPHICYLYVLVLQRLPLAWTLHVTSFTMRYRGVKTPQLRALYCRLWALPFS